MSGRIHARSDLDIAALFEDGPPSLDRVVALGTDLQGLCPGRDVDVAVINHADPLFLKKILERCELLHGSPRVLAELRMYAFRPGQRSVNEACFTSRELPPTKTLKDPGSASHRPCAV